MRKITFLFLCFLVGWQANAQVLTIGTGTTNTQGTSSNPVSGYYMSQRYQVVYTAAELATMMTPYDEITGLGFSVCQDYTGGDLLGYTIKIGHTTATNASAHMAVPFTEVKSAFDYDPTVQAAGSFDMIAFDVPFVWNGIENIVIDICTDGPNPYVETYGGVRTSTLTNGGRIIRSDDDPMCGEATTATINNRPNISFTYTEGTPPSCAQPITLSASAVTSTTATLNWIESGTATAWNIEYGEEGFAQGTGTAANNVSNAHPISPLLPQTTYEFYVQSICESATSTWSGPYSFRTLCAPFDDFTEDFESTPTNGMTECWSRKIISTSASSYIYASEAEPNQGAKSLRFGNSDAPDAVLYAITPTLTALPLGTHQLKFFALGYSATVQVGTMTNPNDESTFTLVETVPVGENYALKTVNFNAPTTDSYVAFKVSFEGTYNYITIDDILWTPIPSVAPSCINDVSVDLNEECGNYATTLSWDHAEGADGYKLLLGTTTGGTELLTEVTGNLGYVDSYSFTGDFDTEYFYTLIPYNANGNAIGCMEASFTTAENGCYCISEPEYLDGEGITHIQIGTNDFDIATETYIDNSNEIIDFGQGLTSNLQITLNTEDPFWGFAFAYDVNVWIDFNDNYNFEPNEIVFSGTSLEEANTVLNASFAMPESAPLGQHRLRIGSSFSGEQDEPDACYTGDDTYGVTVDFTINVVVVECEPPVATAVIDTDCDNAQFFVAVDVTDLGNGAPLEVIDADATVLATITTTGMQNIGPFESGTSVILKLHHATDILCDLSLGTFAYTCPPINDTCATAIDLGTQQSPIEGTTIAATNDNLIICNNSNEEIENTTPDVYYSIVVPPANTLQIGLTDLDFDSAVVVFYGDCTNRTPIACFDDPDDFTVTWGNNTGSPQTVYWVQDSYSGQGNFTLEWSLVECTSPEVTFTINSLCDDQGGEGFQITANITNMGTATSLTVTDDLGNSIPVTAAGPIVMGPYENDTDVVITVGNDQNADCGTVSPTLNQVACPPANDDCISATALIPGNTFAAGAIAGSVFGATDSSNAPDPDCDGYGGRDIWYSVVVPADGNITVEVGPSGTDTGFDSVIELYSGTCDTLTYIDCDDDGADTAAFSIVELSGRTPGETIFVRVWGYGNDEEEPFTISAWNTSLGTPSFSNDHFMAYPNPVKDVLKLSYTQNISSVEVINLLGQQVMATAINSTNGSVDMSNLAAGTYMVKVYTDNLVKTVKVIKQ